MAKRQVFEMEIQHYMLNNWRDALDKNTGQVNATKLAEDTAWALGHSEWLDDQDHIVWWYALEVAIAKSIP